MANKDTYSRRKVFNVGDKVQVKTLCASLNLFSTIRFDPKEIGEVVGSTLGYFTTSRYDYSVRIKSTDGELYTARFYAEALILANTSTNYKPYDVLVYDNSHVVLLIGEHPEETNKYIFQRIKGEGSSLNGSANYKKCIEVNNFLVTRKDSIYLFGKGSKQYFAKNYNACFAISFKASEYSDIVRMLHSKNYKIKVHSLRCTSVYTLYFYPEKKLAIVGRSNKKKAIEDNIDGFIPNFASTSHVTIETGIATFKRILNPLSSKKATTLSSAVSGNILSAPLTGLSIEFPTESESISLSPIQIKPLAGLDL